jgi:hypothetical protein
MVGAIDGVVEPFQVTVGSIDAVIVGAMVGDWEGVALGENVGVLLHQESSRLSMISVAE